MKIRKWKAQQPNTKCSATNYTNALIEQPNTKYRMIEKKYLMVRNNLLVLLPEQTEQMLRETEAGFTVSTLDALKYDPAHGTVVGVGLDCKDCLIGDEVFFNKVLWANAKECAWGSSDERFVNEYQGHREFALTPKSPKGDLNSQQPVRYYMVIPEDKVWMVEFVQDGKVVPVNGHVVAEKITPKSPKGDLNSQQPFAVVDFREEDYEINQVRIVHGGGSLFLDKGDIVQTLRHCDLFVEEKLNNAHLPEEWFIIEEENIISKLVRGSRMAVNGKAKTQIMEYKAANRRVIVQPEEVSTEQSNGLTNTDSLRTKVLTAKVLSIGEGVTSCKVGDRIVYARNSGMALPALDGGSDLLLLKDGGVDSEIYAIVNP